MVDALAANGGVADVRGGRAEVAAVEVAEDARAADCGGLERAVARVHRLRALEEEQARAGACRRVVSTRPITGEIGEEGRKGEGDAQWFASMSVT